MRNIRDLAAWVDTDPPLQAAYRAVDPAADGAPLAPANPYVSQITNQDAFTTFGPVEWFDLIGRAPRPHRRPSGSRNGVSTAAASRSTAAACTTT